MPLDNAAAVAAVTDWHQIAGVPLSDEDAQLLAGGVIDLAAALVPLIVDPDNVLTGEEEQDYLVARVQAEIADWLTRAASALRVQLRLDPPVLRADGTPSLGVRAATVAELDAVPGLGPARAAAIARLVRMHPNFTALTDLTAIDGIGQGTVAALEEHLYLDSPAVTLTSRAHLDFARSPGPATYVKLLSGSDLELVVTDGTMLQRRSPAGGTVTQRLVRLISYLTGEAALALSPAGGVLAEDVAAYLSRQIVRSTALAGMHPADGQLLNDEAYLAAAAELIAQAGERVLLMVFLGTDSAGTPQRPGPAALIEALESRAAAGLDVRVVLDQDDDGVPYGSAFINRDLHKRLAAHPQVQVKLDDPAVLLHSKVLVVDHTAVIVGSHNWTRAGMQDTHELSVLLRGRDITDAYAARFQSVWDSIP